MSCTKCNQTKCCCDEKRVNVLGPKGPQGPAGKSVYIYIAYASNVVPGTPDVVTGFSLTVPDCWMAIRVSNIPLVPVQSDFQGLWKKYCGADGTNGSDGATGAAGPQGPPGTPLASAADSDALVFEIRQSNSNLNIDIPTNNSIIVGATGTYIIHAQIEYAKIVYPSANISGGNFIYRIKVNGVQVAFCLNSMNNQICDLECSPSVFVFAALTAADVVTTVVQLQTPNTDEVVNFSASKSKLVIQQLS